MGDEVVGDMNDDDDAAEIVADENDVGDKKDSSDDVDDADDLGDIAVAGGDTGGKNGWTLFDVHEMIVSSVPSNFQS